MRNTMKAAVVHAFGEPLSIEGVQVPTPGSSIVGTRKDLAEAIEFAHEGKVRAHISKARIEDIDAVFGKLKQGAVQGRIVPDIARG